MGGSSHHPSAASDFGAKPRPVVVTRAASRARNARREPSRAVGISTLDSGLEDRRKSMGGSLQRVMRLACRLWVGNMKIDNDRVMIGTDGWTDFPMPNPDAIGKEDVVDGNPEKWPPGGPRRLDAMPASAVAQTGIGE